MLACGMAICVSCSCRSLSWDYYYVEIAPGQFVPVKFHKHFKGYMEIKYKEIIVAHANPPELNKPECLMEYDGKLYILSFYAYDRHLKDWRWIAFKQDGNKFKEIPLSEFPRSVALLNLWYPDEKNGGYSRKHRRYFIGVDGETVDQLSLIRDFDVTSKYFTNNDTVRLWYCLEIANDWGRAQRDSDVDVKAYIEKYKPVRMTSMEMKPVPAQDRDF